MRTRACEQGSVSCEDPGTVEGSAIGGLFLGDFAWWGCRRVLGGDAHSWGAEGPPPAGPTCVGIVPQAHSCPPGEILGSAVPGTHLRWWADPRTRSPRFPLGSVQPRGFDEDAHFRHSIKNHRPLHRRARLSVLRKALGSLLDGNEGSSWEFIQGGYRIYCGRPRKPGSGAACNFLP